jgi:hypothetical protein
MEHFAMHDWIDFVREAIEPLQAAGMQRHLDEGCVECFKNLALWRPLVQFAKQEINQQPPESVVRLVKASFGMQRLAVAEGGEISIATLVFDSARQALAMGVRNTAPCARQLLFRSGSFCIDMRIQPRPGSDDVVLVGQLMDSLQPSRGISGVPVRLLRAGDTVSRKKTDDFGEFDFGFETPHDVQLAFGLKNHRTLLVAVPDADEDSPAMVMQ